MYAFGTGGVIADCPADHPYLLGGGASPSGTDSIQYSQPAGPLGEETPGNGNTYGWLGESTSGGSISVYAICAK